MAHENRTNPGRRNSVFARATAAGPGGISTLILDGADALPRLLPHLRTRRAISGVKFDPLFGRIVDRDGKVVDEVVISISNAKTTPTGNIQIELCCHGGQGALTAVETVLTGAGFEPASGTEL